jgi:RHS repeat-associated protein
MASPVRAIRIARALCSWLAVTNARGKATITTYDDRNRKVTVEDALHHKSEQRFDVAGNLTQSTTPRGVATPGIDDDFTTHYAYDARNRLVMTTLPAGENNKHLVTLNTYDQAGNLKETDEGEPISGGLVKGLRTIHDYDPMHREIANSLWDTTASPSTPVFVSMSQSVYLNNNLSQSIDGLGYHTKYDYDKAGRVLDALAGHVKNLSPTGPAPAAADIVWAKTYDGFGNLARQTQYPDHAKTSTARVTTYTYDTDGRLKTVTEPDPDGGGRSHPQLPMVTIYDYDRAGNLQTVTDPEGVSITHYDARNRVTDSIAPDPDGPGTGPEHAKQPGITSYLFDADGDVTKMTDPANNVTDYTYTDLDQLQSESTHVYTDSVQGDDNVLVTRRYTYDENGNLQTNKDRDDRWRKFIYDARDQLTDEQWLSGGTPTQIGTTVDKSIHYTYDTLGHQTSGKSNAQDPNNHTTDYRLTFNGAGQIKLYEQGVHDGAGFPDAMLFQTYDARGQLFQQNAMIGQANDYANTYTYTPDALANPAAIFQLAGGRGKRVAFGVNQIGQITSIDRQTNATLKKGGSGSSVPGAYRTYGYDKAGELAAIGLGGKAYEYAYTKDQKHRVTKIQQPHQPDQNYTYFFDDELKTAPGQTLDYDQNFNRTTDGSQTGADNRLKEDATYKYEYDKESNLTSRIKKSDNSHVDFEYDDRNRLIGASFYNSSNTLLKSVGYTYDAADRLTRRVGGIGGTQRYVYDGSAGPSASDDVIFVFAGDTISPQTLSSRHTNGPGAHNVLAEDTPGLVPNAKTYTFWHINDDKGSTRKLVDDGGNLISSLDYDAWGQLTTHTGPVPLVGYTGQRADVDTGLTLMGKRWYQPINGRFTSQDPLREGTNVTDYVRNNPMNYMDPTGLSATVTGIAQGAEDQADSYVGSHFSYCACDVPAAPTQQELDEAGDTGLWMLGAVERLVTSPKKLLDKTGESIKQRIEHASDWQKWDNPSYENGRLFGAAEAGPKMLASMLETEQYVRDFIHYVVSGRSDSDEPHAITKYVDSVANTLAPRFQGDDPNAFDIGRSDGNFDFNIAVALASAATPLALEADAFEGGAQLELWGDRSAIKRYGIATRAASAESAAATAMREEVGAVGALEDWEGGASAVDRLAARDAAWEADNAINIHGNSAQSVRTSYVYQLRDVNGNPLKWGITQNMAKRYPKAFLADKVMMRIASGTRRDMLDLERDLVETQPGPRNHEPWAGSRAGGQ